MIIYISIYSKIKEGVIEMLKKLATPFIKFWHWIKETAWIQPLLLVGLVLGGVFSISPIVQACSNMQEEADLSFYINNRITMDKADVNDSKVDKLLDGINEAATNQDAEAVTAAKNEVRSISKADKFFLLFYSESCEACKNSVGGFNYLKDNWNKSDAFKSDEDLKLVSIDTKEESVNEKEEYDKKEAFAFVVENNTPFFETVWTVIGDTYYAKSGKISETTLSNFGNAIDNMDSFPEPTLILIDLNSENVIEELMFSISGDGDGAKAMQLMDCWNQTGDFSEIDGD